MSTGVHSCHIQKGRRPDSPKTHVIISGMKATHVACSAVCQAAVSPDGIRHAPVCSNRTGQNETFETETASATLVLFGSMQTFLRPVSFCPVTARGTRALRLRARLFNRSLRKMRTLCIQNATKNANVNFLLRRHQPLTILTPESVRIFRVGSSRRTLDLFYARISRP
jgi:hypothetical protein